MTLELATRIGRTASVARRLRGEGATVEGVDATVGYLRIAVSPRELEQIYNLGPDVEAAAVVALSARGYELQGEASQPANAGPPTDAPAAFDTRLAGSQYTGAPAMGVDSFIEDHPTFDGRGVTIGFLESADPQAPGLQIAYDLSGRPVRKLGDFGVVGSPATNIGKGGQPDEHNGWVDMRAVVHAVGRQIRFRGRTFGVPYDGIFNVGIFHGERYGDEPLSSAIPGQSPDITILWDRASGRIWFDARHNSVFDRRAVEDYAVNGDVVKLPLVYPRGSGYMAGHLLDTRAWLRFATKTKPRLGFINLIQVGDVHGDMVVSSAAGDGMFDGRMNGIAPGARVIMVSCPSSLDLEGILWAVHHGADIVSGQALSQFAGRGAREVWKVVIHRVVLRYGTVFTWSAGNYGPAIGVINTVASLPDVFGIGGYLTRQNQRLDEGMNFEGIATYSSRGPGVDGSLAPILLAPTEWLSDGSAYMNDFRIARKWRLPGGYMVGGGTSQAAPTAAGAIALLISAARQRHISYNVASLRQALLSTAHSVGMLPIDQGFGLINVPAAWRVLRAGHGPATVAFDRPAVFEMDVRACAPMIYTFRISGNENSRVRVLWTGPPGGHVIHSTLSLLRGVWAPIQIRLAPLVGNMVLSGIVEVREANSGILLGSESVTRICPLRFSAVHGYTITSHGMLGHPGYLRYFIDVPPGASVLAISLRERATGPGWKPGIRAWYMKFNPLRIVQPGSLQSPEASVHWPASKEGHWETAIAHPTPGIWQVALFGGDSGFMAGEWSVPSSPITLRAAVYGVSLRRCVRVAGGMHCAYVNRFAPFTAVQVDAPAMVVDRERIPVTLNPSRPYSEIYAPLGPGASDLRIRLAGHEASLLSADLFYCLSARPTLPFAMGGPFYRGKCPFRAHGEGSAALDTSQPTGTDSAFGASTDATPGRWVVIAYAKYPLRSTVHVTAVITRSYAREARAITSVSVPYVGIGENFNAIVRSTISQQVPTIASAGVVTTYQPYVVMDGQLKYLPYVTTEVPIMW